MINVQCSRRVRESSFPIYLLFISCLLNISVTAQQKKVEEVVKEKYELGGTHSKDPQNFMMQSQLVQLGPDGTRKDSTLYTLYLHCVPGRNVEEGDEYTCTRFTVRSNSAAEVSIPALAGWKYVYNKTSNAKDEKGQVFGIDHAKFEKVVDSNGQGFAN
jgi:hypothetical protein